MAEQKTGSSGTVLAIMAVVIGLLWLLSGFLGGHGPFEP